MRVDLLSERERECLRLLARPMRAKEIARTLDLSVYTVHDHLKSARRKLGVGDSMTAAMMLREHETGPPESVGTTESGWSDGGKARHQEPAERSNGWADNLPFPVRGRPWNDMSLGWRILWPLLLMGFLAMGVGILVGGIAALSQLALSFSE
ncbi:MULTISPECIES: response regulator transcription factor [Brevundimonas]|uniref:response regulator transcription factor n=1 Tax=Brevundimonas TaxID=41275 RepID=UPI0005EC4788|nr:MULTISPECIES: helix-turn-helix domain-containing protein [Brevundimonas]